MGCGYAFTFGTFSEALRTDYPAITNDDISTIGTGTTVVGLITSTIGIYTDWVGQRIALATGACINIVGWLVYAVLATHGLGPANPTVLFMTLGCIAAYGAAICTGAVFGMVTKNFVGPERGIAVGTTKAWVGVASGFATTVYVGIWPSDAAAPERLDYLYFLPISIAVFVLLPMPLMRVMDGADSLRDSLCLSEPFRFTYLQASTLSLVVVTLFTATTSESDALMPVHSGMLLALALLPLFSLLPGTRARVDQSVGLLAQPHADQDSILDLGTATIWESPWACGPAEMMTTPDAWFLWLNMGAVRGGGIMLATNVGSICSSRSGPSVDPAVPVAIFSAMSAIGRLAAGVFSDRLVHRHQIARPWYFVGLTMCQALAMAILLIPGPVPVHIGSALSGYAFGSVVCVTVTTTAYLFGMERIASNYMIYDGTPSAVASLAIAKYGAQFIYDNHELDSEGNCNGDVCYSMAYVMVIAVEAVACIAAVALAVRSRVVYEKSVWLDVSTLDEDTFFPQPCRMRSRVGWA